MLISHLEKYLNKFLILKVLEGAFNLEKVLVEALSGQCTISERFADIPSFYPDMVNGEQWAAAMQ